MLLVSGVRWVEMAAEYCPTAGVWLDPIPIVAFMAWGWVPARSRTAIPESSLVSGLN